MKLLILPQLRQTYEFDCGPKVLQSVLAYYGLEIQEDAILRLAKTTRKSGTSLSGMLRTLKKFGLKYHSKKMNLSVLKKYLDKKIPVILLVQAWGKDPKKYKDGFKDGHWVTTIGYDKTRFFFEDPYSFRRTFLREDELLERWHGRGNNRKNLQLGIAVYGKKPKYKPKRIIHMD